MKAAGDRNLMRRRPILEEIEPRILYSADMSVLPVPPLVAEHRTIDGAGEFEFQAQPRAASLQVMLARDELVFVEKNTPDYDSLVAGIKAQSDAQRHIEVILLDPAADGIAQIGSALSGRRDVSAVHVISHGTDGQVQLGSATLNFDSLLKNAAKIKAWGQALSASADFLIYGCDVAQSTNGKALIDALARLTGADVAASEDLTGSSQQGANWALEYADGRIDTRIVVPYAAQTEWDHTLLNSAPTLSGANDMNTINEDAVVNPGTAVSALIAGRTSDADINAFSGIAVTDVQNGNGSWKYSTDGGGTWQPFPIGTIKPSSALLLAADSKTYIRFSPSTDWNGTKTNALSFRAWDQTSGTAGTMADTTISGGATAFSSAIASASITVASVNDAPSGTNKTITILEDTRYTITSGDFGFIDPKDSPANHFAAVMISEIQGAGSLRLSGISVTAGQSISVSSIAAGNLRFTPATNGNGTGYASFSFEVQDDGGTARGGVDTDVSGKTITIDVTPVNDPPVGSAKTVVTRENAQFIFAVSDFGFTDPYDHPANGLNAIQIVTLPTAGTITLSGAPVTAGKIIPVASLSSGSLKYAPPFGVVGADAASFEFKLEDDGGTANGGIDLEAVPHTITIDVALNSLPTTVTPTATGLAMPMASNPVSLSVQSLDAPLLLQKGTSADWTTPRQLAVYSASMIDVSKSVPQLPSVSAEDSSIETTQTDRFGLRGTESRQSAQAAIAVLEDRVSVRHPHAGNPLFRTSAFLLSHADVASENTPMLSESIMDAGFGREGLNYSAQTALSPLNSRAWNQELNRVREAQAASITAHQRLMTSTIVVSAGMSVGYVVWLLRGGLLLGSLLSSLPAWQVIDPLPVLARSKRLTEEAPGADPLEHLFNRVRAIVSGGGESSVRRIHGALNSASLGATDDARVSSVVINNAKAAT